MPWAFSELRTTHLVTRGSSAPWKQQLCRSVSGRGRSNGVTLGLLDSDRDSPGGAAGELGMGVVGSQGEESGGSRRRGRGELGPRGEPESWGRGRATGRGEQGAGSASPGAGPGLPAAHQAGSEPTATVRCHVGPCTSSLSPQHLQAPLPTPSTLERPQHRFPIPESPLHLGSLSGASNLEVFNTA